MSKNSSSTSFPLLVLMLLFGAGIMYFLAPEIIPQKEKKIEKKLTNEYAKVTKINDLYVFIESTPANSNYTTLDVIEGDKLNDIWSSLGIGKDKFGKVLTNIINTGKKNLVFNEMLIKMTEKVSNEFQDASGVIFLNNMRKCQVIKFKTTN